MMRDGGQDLGTEISDFPGGPVVKNPPASAGDIGFIPGSERSLGGGHGNPLQCSCLENPMDRGAWSAKVHGVSESEEDLAAIQQQQLFLQPFKPSI